QSGVAHDPQISLFDVSDLSSPKLVGRYTVESVGTWSWSPVFETHHAFSFFEDLGILAVPFGFAPSWNILPGIEHPNLPLGIAEGAVPLVADGIRLITEVLERVESRVRE